MNYSKAHDGDALFIGSHLIHRHCETIYMKPASRYKFFLQGRRTPLPRPLCLKWCVAWFAVSSLLTNSVLAEIPPVPDEQLVRDSDLIIEADVLSVAKIGDVSAPAWLAWLRVRATLKGEVPSNPMPYWFLPPEPGLIGGRNESVFAGEHVRLYLIRDRDGRYEAWASNSIEILEEFDPSRRILPTKFGEIIHAGGTRSNVKQASVDSASCASAAPTSQVSSFCRNRPAGRPRALFYILMWHRR